VDTPDPGLRRFDEMLWADGEALRARYSDLLRRDRDAFLTMMDRAYERNDLKTTVLGGEVMLATGAMRRSDALNVGVGMARLGRFPDAMAAFDHRKLIDADWPQYLVWRARALAGVGRRAEAEETLGKALDKRPGYPEALLLRAELSGQVETPDPERDHALHDALELEAAGSLDVAIERLGQLSAAYPLDATIRAALARCVGRSVLETVRPRLERKSTGRIVNLLPFYDEFTMFRMRLHEMADWVDHFVVIEAAKTFTGLDKPLFFQRRKAEFAAYADRISHVVVDSFPPCVSSAWGRDFFQRDMGAKALAELCGPDDLVLLTDADEIVDRRALEGFDGEFASLQMPTFKYFLNYRPAVGHRKHALRKSSIWRARYLEAFGSSYLRFYLAGDDLRTHVIPNAGWHFTSMMDATAVSRKVDSYAHQEQTKKHLRDEAHYRNLLERIRRGEFEDGWERCEIDGSYPSFVRDRRDEVAHLLI
jgi:hypothetical protein